MSYRGVIDSVITLFSIPEATQRKIVAACEFANPVYQEALAHSPYGYVSSYIPEKLNFAWTGDEGEFYLNRGSVSFLNQEFQNLVKQAEYRYANTVHPVQFPALRLTLTKEQKQCLRALERKSKFGTILFTAPTAVGKTILAAAVAKELGQKTLILCPTDLIIRGWQSDLQKAFGLTKDQLGLIKQKQWNFGKQFTIASVATLNRRRRNWDMVHDEFGTVIVDEVHGIAAPSLFDFVSTSPAKYLVGITATKESREGGRNLHLQALFGDPLLELNTYHKETETSLRITEVKMVNTDFEYAYQEGNLDWHDFAETLALDDDRNRLIVANVKKEWEQGRVILLTTKRLPHVEILYELLREAGVDNVNRLTGETNVDKEYTNRLLRLIKKRKVTCVVGTNMAIQTGANIPVLDSIHIAMPLANKRNLEQLLGRIRRKAEGKTEATLTYYFDKKVGYTNHLYRKVLIPVFRRMRLPGFEGMYLA